MSSRQTFVVSVCVCVGGGGWLSARVWVRECGYINVRVCVCVLYGKECMYVWMAVLRAYRSVFESTTNNFFVESICAES